MNISQMCQNILILVFLPFYTCYFVAVVVLNIWRNKCVTLISVLLLCFNKIKNNFVQNIFMVYCFRLTMQRPFWNKFLWWSPLDLPYHMSCRLMIFTSNVIEQRKKMCVCFWEGGDKERDCKIKKYQNNGYVIKGNSILNNLKFIIIVYLFSFTTNTPNIIQCCDITVLLKFNVAGLCSECNIWFLF